MAIHQTVLTALQLAQEEVEAEASNATLVLPEINELIAGVIAFAIVFYFVWKKALPTIDRTLEKRQAAVRAQYEEAEKAKTEAESLASDYRRQMDDTKARQNEIMDEARQQAENLRSEIVARANTEAEGIVAKAREEAAGERARAMAEARRDVANLSIDLAEKVVGQSLDRKAQLGLVDRYLDELERM